ncbi:hypothetical protein PLICRDRAFT_83678, partial [Plicaturopsis crispa FD-325 SS-3]
LGQIEIQVCACRPAASQLLARGLFPCAPRAPSLAVDLRMLEFVRTLFVRVPPNATAWCDALEDFLDGRGYKLDSRNSLRRRFSNAVVWYGSLVNAAKYTVASFLQEIREGVRSTLPEEEAGGTPPVRRRVVVEEVDDEESLPSSGRSSDLRSEGDSADGAVDDDDVPPLSRPSEYLRQRCPLCFGGKTCHDPSVVYVLDMADVIACLDACFTQKRRKNADGHRDAPRTHPESVFVPEEDVQAMRDFVEATRGSSKTRPGGRAQEKHRDDDGDQYEGEIRVPNSVLDECKDSFGAADEQREAASTQFFADTGLMGLLCRHDRVLWLISM